ncbi:MAG TPA: AI-2E family transporter [Falsiroseomonas sp.]|jgi:predicted PurR-regulated permease PerM|nr:AI-2E family transporter [Falsiroseomonas sp.]
MPDSLPDRPSLPPRIRAAEVPGLSSLPLVVAGVVTVAALYFGRELLIPLTLAVLLSFVLAPVVSGLRRLWLPRVAAVLLAALLALSAGLFVTGLMATQVAELTAEVPRYAYTMERKLDTLRGLTVDPIVATLDRISGTLEETSPDSAAEPQRSPSRSREAAPPLPVEVRQPDPTPLEMTRRIVQPVLAPLANAAIVFVVAVFILLQREDLRDRVIRLAGSGDLHRTTTALDDAARRLSRYFLTQLVINTAYGTVTGVVLYLIDVPGALLWGTLAGLMRYVPFVGTPIAAAPPILLAAAVDPGWTMALLTAAWFLVGEATMGQVVEPIAFGQSTGLSPVSVIIAAIFWSWLWGPIGLIMAMPLTLCLVVLGRHVERLAFLDVLLGDQPALTPHESFYQRMLAGDPDEALDQAEQLLRERPLSAYYDEVVLKGLQLAAADVASGTLPLDRLQAVRDAARSVVADLADHPEVASTAAATKGAERNPPVSEGRPRVPEGPPATLALPSEWTSPRAVLCIAGRSPLDEAAAVMLAQLLGKHGLGAEVVPHVAVARDQLARLDVTGVAMVCLCYLQITGSPAHLRYTLRRLRQRAPGVQVLVGLWPPQEAVLNDREQQAAIGADSYAASLRDAVSACLEAARAASTPAPGALAPAAP